MSSYKYICLSYHSEQKKNIIVIAIAAISNALLQRLFIIFYPLLTLVCQRLVVVFLFFHNR
jgi:hypothetical protein